MPKKASSVPAGASSSGADSSEALDSSQQDAGAVATAAENAAVQDQDAGQQAGSAASEAAVGAGAGRQAAGAAAAARGAEAGQDAGQDAGGADGQPSWLDLVRKQGFENVESEEDARQRLLDAYQQERSRLDELEKRWQQFEPLIAYGQQYIDSLQKQQAGGQPAGQAAQAAAAPEQPSVWPQIPEVDLDAVERYRDDKGEWKFNTPPELRHQAEQAAAAIQKWQVGMALRPQQTLEPIIKQVARQVSEELLREQFGMEPKELVQRLDLSGEQQFVQQQANELAPVLYERDPRTGQLDLQRLSAVGQAFTTALEDLERGGMSSAASRMYFARQLIAPLLTQQQQQQVTQAAQQQAAKKKTEHLHRGAARSVADRDGSVSRNQDGNSDQNKHESFGTATVRKMLDGGVMFT